MSIVYQRRCNAGYLSNIDQGVQGIQCFAVKYFQLHDRKHSSMSLSIIYISLDKSGYQYNSFLISGQKHVVGTH